MLCCGIHFALVALPIGEYPNKNIEKEEKMKNEMILRIILAFAFIISLGITSPAIGQEKAEMGVQVFSVSTMVVAEEVQDREPVGVSETFPVSTEKVYCFIEATNISSINRLTARLNSNREHSFESIDVG